MEWKKQLTEYETNGEWLKAIPFLENIIEENPNEAEPEIRIIYLLHNLLVEEDYGSYGLTHDYLAKLLLKYFQESYLKFESNPEYLFFVGIIMHIAEWYFGQDDTKLALQLQKRAWEMEPANILFEFSYAFSTSNKAKSKGLAEELTKDSGKVQWLKSKGYPGQYVLEIITAVQEGR